MLSKAVIDIPYYCKEPLCADTTWLAVPILISSKAKELSKASARVKEIMNSVPGILAQLPTSPFSADLLAFDVSFEELQATMEFLEINDNEFQACIYNFVVIKFPEKGQFLEKMQFISEALDKLYAFAKKSKSEKNINIQLGEKYRFHK